MKRRILIVGGGYAGAMCAARLGRKAAPGAEVVLVNARPWFVERVRLHQDVAGSGPPRRSLASLVGATRVRLLFGHVAGIDLASRRVRFDEGLSEAFDELVLATGSRAAHLDLPGSDRIARMVTEADALPLRGRLDGLGRARVVVLGGGLTGIELATELAESRPGLRLSLITDGEVGEDLSPRAREHVRRALAARGVDLVERARVEAVEDGGVVLSAGAPSWLACDLVIGAAGMRAMDLAREAEIETDALGRVVVDEHLRARSHDFVRAIGDAARVEMRGADGVARVLRMACATALPMGAHVADSLARELTARPPEPLSFGYAARCISLGRRDGAIQRVDREDRVTSAASASIRGRVGAWIKEGVCRFAIGSIAMERRGLGYAWPRASRSPKLLGDPTPPGNILTSR